MSRACFECSSSGPLHEHHVVPVSRGGTKTVPLCEMCHAKAHHRSGSMSTSSLTREAMQRKAGAGEYTGGRPPFGYDVDEDGKTLVPNRHEQQTVKMAMDARCGGASLREIAELLDRLGRQPKSGGRWYAQTVRRLLQ
jgi:hypothetical protein